MGDYLNEKGFTCLGIRLHGHATKPEDMIASRWTDWLASVEDGFNLLSGMTDRIYVLGLSMGGVLSLLVASIFDVQGVVAMSTPYRLKDDYPVWTLRLFSKFMEYHEKSKQIPGSNWRDKAAFADHISYPHTPIRSVGELQILLAKMRESLPDIRKPVLLMHSLTDDYVPPVNMDWIYDGLVNAPKKEKVYITESSHVVTKDAARQRVFESAFNFIQNIESKISLKTV